MRGYIAVAVLALGLMACVTLPPRYNYRPSTSSGIQCKANCTAMYQDCRERAMDSCRALNGQRCMSETAPMIKNKMTRCINEEKSCLKVCQRSS